MFQPFVSNDQLTCYTFHEAFSNSLKPSLLPLNLQFCFLNATSNFQTDRTITLFSIIFTALAFKKDLNKFLLISEWPCSASEFHLPPINVTLEIPRSHLDTSFLNGGWWSHRVTTWNVGRIKYVATSKRLLNHIINRNCFWLPSSMLHGTPSS